MCDTTAWLSGGMGVAGEALSFMGQRSNAKAINAAKMKQAKNMIKSSNYALQDLEGSRRGAFESTVAAIMQAQHQGKGLKDQVMNAVNEEMGEGRTANLIERSVDGDTARAVNSMQHNYREKSDEISQNMERTVMNTQAQLQGIQFEAMPSFLPSLLRMGSIGLEAYQGYLGRDSSRTAALNGTNKQS